MLNLEGIDVIKGDRIPVAFHGFNVRALQSDTLDEEEADRKEEEKVEAVSNGNVMH